MRGVRDRVEFFQARELNLQLFEGLFIGHVLTQTGFELRVEQLDPAVILFRGVRTAILRFFIFIPLSLNLRG
jgi:hypothetical protein